MNRAFCSESIWVSRIDRSGRSCIIQVIDELNREANTLGSKATAIDLAQSAIELKLLIEQMREQVQNLE